MREFLECDYAERQTECDQCPDSRGQEADPEGYCPVCPLRKLNQRFPPEFRDWVYQLVRLYLWRKAGYVITEELTYEQWDALAMITRWYEVRDLEASMSAAGGIVP